MSSGYAQMLAIMMRRHDEARVPDGANEPPRLMLMNAMLEVVAPLPERRYAADIRAHRRCRRLRRCLVMPFNASLVGFST